MKDWPTLEQLAQALESSWGVETGYADGISWSPDNPARGQCVVSSLVVQDYLGGELVRYRVRGEDISETHYCNVLPDGSIVDTTASQYQESVEMVLDMALPPGYDSYRDRFMDDDETATRYKVLKSKVATTLSNLSLQG